MKKLAAVCALMVLVASGAGAVEIEGKWGIGAGVFGGGAEVSLIRGASARSAWLVDVGIKQSYLSAGQEVSPAPPFPLGSETRRRWSILAGPGYRRFTRPTEEFSPYWDARVRGSWFRESNSSGSDLRRSQTGVEGEFSIGLEYFTRWHFSVAAHSGLARVGWSRLVQRQSVPGSEARFTRNSEFVGIGLSPVLFVRGYF